MKSIAKQTVQELGGAGSVLVPQRQDHMAVDGLLEQRHSADRSQAGRGLAQLLRQDVADGVVSRRPPGNVLAALPLNHIDRSRNAADGAGRASGRRVRTGAQPVNLGTVGAAGAVERLGAMNIGGNADTHRYATAEQAR